MDLKCRSYGKWKYGNSTASEVLLNMAEDINMKINDQKFQEYLDNSDNLKRFRSYFIIPNTNTYPKGFFLFVAN